MPRMTLELLSRCTGHAKRKRGETNEHLLQRVTHLYCAEKGIQTIEELHNCYSLSVLYLYDNLISMIEGVSSCQNLTHLYLQNNHITKMEGFETLGRLSKLYLSGNGIAVVEGLDNCTELSELHLAHQRLPEGEKLLFDPRSLQAIAPSLVLLNVSGNCLDSVEDLHPLHQLTHFIAANNQLHSMKDLSLVISHWRQLWRVELTGNPLCNKYKYRDRVITMGTCIAMLDGREVKETERQFLACWKASRKARKKASHQNRKSQMAGSLSTSQHILTTEQQLPHTISALPSHLPLRVRKKQGQRLEVEQSAAFRLPDILPQGPPIFEVSSSLHLPASLSQPPYPHHPKSQSFTAETRNHSLLSMMNY